MCLGMTPAEFGALPPAVRLFFEVAAANYYDRLNHTLTGIRLDS